MQYETERDQKFWNDGYNTAVNAAIRELRTPLQNLVDAIASGDESKIKKALVAANRGLEIYDAEKQS